MAAPAGARIVFQGDGTFLQAVDGDRLVFIAIGSDDRQGVVRLNLRTGAKRRLYRAPGPFTIFYVRARDGHAGIESINESTQAVRVASVPLAGGTARTVATASYQEPCYDYLRLVGVASGGDVVTDEIGCHDPAEDEPGTLFAYGPAGGRSVFGTRHVPGPERLEFDAELSVVGDRWVTLDKGLFDRGPEKLFLGESATDDGRRLLKFRSIKAFDLNEQGDAIALLRRPRAHPKRPFRVWLFPHGGGAREVASARDRPFVNLCGRGLAVLAWARDRTAQRLLFQDTPGGPAREVFRRPRPHGKPGIRHVVCNERWYAHEVSGPKGTTLSVAQLKPK